MILITYADNKNVAFEQQVSQMVEKYDGEMKSEFQFDSGNFEAKAKFSNKEQEVAFRKDLEQFAKRSQISVTFGGTY